MIDNRFDNIIKNKLADFKSDMTPDWDNFVAKRFDDTVSDKLSGHESTATPRWDLFLEKQNQIVVKHKDRAFDNTVRQNLGDYKMAYNSSHWVLLKDRLERIYASRQALYSLKTLELLVLLLLMINFTSSYVQKNQSIASIEQVNANAVSSEVSSEEINSTNDLIQNQNQINTITEEVVASENLITSHIITGSDFNQNTIDKTLNANDKAINNIFTNNIETNTQSVSIPFTESGKGGPSNAISIASSLGSSNINNREGDLVDVNELDNSSHKDVSFISPVEKLSGGLLTIENEIQNPVSYNSTFGIKPYSAANNSWFQIVFSFDNNNVRTKFDKGFFPRGATSDAFSEMHGYTIAGMYSKDYGQFELEAGLAYSDYNKSWNYIEEFEVGSDLYLYSLSNIQYNIISTPLKVKYHFVQNLDWSLFASIGLSPELIADANYNESTQKRNFTGGQPTSGTGTEPLTVEDFYSKFQKTHDFNRGVFNGDSFSDNFFMRASLGFGMQRNISQNVSAYFSGDFYMTVLNGELGPHRDRINKMAFSLGIKRKI